MCSSDLFPSHDRGVTIDNVLRKNKEGMPSFSPEKYNGIDVKMVDKITNEQLTAITRLWAYLCVKFNLDPNLLHAQDLLKFSSFLFVTYLVTYFTICEILSTIFTSIPLYFSGENDGSVQMVM